MVRRADPAMAAGSLGPNSASFSGLSPLLPSPTQNPEPGRAQTQRQGRRGGGGEHGQEEQLELRCP